MKHGTCQSFPERVVPFAATTVKLPARMPTLDFSDPSVRQRYRGVRLDLFLAIATHNRYAVHCIYGLKGDEARPLAARQLRVLVMGGNVTRIWAA